MSYHDPAEAEAIERAIGQFPPKGMSGAAILTNFVVVAEWTDSEGGQFLTRQWMPSRPLWDAKGMLHEALLGDWPVADDRT